jgi:hypothetical protein
MELNKIKQRLELALRPAEPPTIEEVLEQVLGVASCGGLWTGYSRAGCCT